jgi:23S rRNA (uracil1939-C5)-methyltransferase
VRQLARSEGWTGYNSRTNAGYLKNLVLRTVQHSKDVMVNLVTTAHKPDRLRLFTETLLSGFPQIKTILNSINPGRSPVAVGEMELISYGDGTIRESVGELSFEIGPTSFFQPNTLQAERMFASIAELGHVKPGHTVYDLFCGLGTIGQYIASRVEKVVGVENNESSVNLARKNCGINNLDNCVFEVGDAADALHPDFVARYGRPDRLILDPPRPGLHPQVCDGILREGPERIIYTSCNPATQARDLKLLSALYTVEEVLPIDMFPQTYHIESVAALQRRN